MKTASLIRVDEPGGSKPKIEILFETDFTKEIRIAFKKDQVMKEHKTPYPIVVEVFEGAIDFGVREKIHPLKKGALLPLGGTPQFESYGKQHRSLNANKARYRRTSTKSR